MLYNEKTKFLVLDVESSGLYGEPFAFGYVITNKNKVLGEGIHVSEPLVYKTEEDEAWVKENVFPNLPLPNVGIKDLPRKFLDVWKEHEGSVKYIVTDVGYPVETNFLSKVFEDLPMEESPYPIIDLGTLLFAGGVDPTTEFPRDMESEHLIHNPLHDARQSARILRAVLKEMEKRD